MNVYTASQEHITLEKLNYTVNQKKGTSISLNTRRCTGERSEYAEKS